MYQQSCHAVYHWVVGHGSLQAIVNHGLFVVGDVLYFSGLEAFTAVVNHGLLVVGDMAAFKQSWFLINFRSWGAIAFHCLRGKTLKRWIRKVILGPRSPSLYYTYLLGLLAMIKCSICSYQCDNWYIPNRGFALSLWFFTGEMLLWACSSTLRCYPGIAHCQV